jgi:hypothetical protein
MSDDMNRKKGTELGKSSPTSYPQSKWEEERRFTSKETK